jgi:hypothetical protein
MLQRFQQEGQNLKTMQYMETVKTNVDLKKLIDKTMQYMETVKTNVDLKKLIDKK